MAVRPAEDIDFQFIMAPKKKRKHTHRIPRSREPVIEPLTALSRILSLRISDGEMVETSEESAEGGSIPSSRLRLAYCSKGASLVNVGTTVYSRTTAKHSGHRQQGGSKLIRRRDVPKKVAPVTALFIAATVTTSPAYGVRFMAVYTPVTRALVPAVEKIVGVRPARCPVKLTEDGLAYC